MITINKYTTYCTEEQTKKAFDLGFDIDMFTEDFDPQDILPEECKPIFIDKREEITHFRYWLVPPTAEQMIGWLEDQECIGCIDVYKIYSVFGAAWVFDIYDNDCYVISNDENEYKSRKEATFAAIDAALEYLKQSKE